jgi:drug/metabolite transporter (DMT)-like permease
LHESRHSTKLIVCLGTVYLVWGSSFLFTKIAVQNLPPALFAGTRFVTAGVLLAVIAKTYGRSHLPAAWIECAT